MSARNASDWGSGSGKVSTGELAKFQINLILLFNFNFCFTRVADPVAVFVMPVVHLAKWKPLVRRNFSVVNKRNNSKR